MRGKTLKIVAVILQVFKRLDIYEFVLFLFLYLKIALILEVRLVQGSVFSPENTGHMKLWYKTLQQQTTWRTLA
jgi:hypothetical protein